MNDCGIVEMLTTLIQLKLNPKWEIPAPTYRHVPRNYRHINKTPLLLLLKIPTSLHCSKVPASLLCSIIFYDSKPHISSHLPSQTSSRLNSSLTQHGKPVHCYHRHTAGLDFNFQAEGSSPGTLPADFSKMGRLEQRAQSCQFPGSGPRRSDAGDGSPRRHETQAGEAVLVSR